MNKHIFILAVSAAFLFGSGLAVASTQIEPGINVMQVDYDIGEMVPMVQMNEPAGQYSDSCHVGYKAGISKTAKYVDKPDGKWLASLPNVGSTAVSVWDNSAPEQRIPRYG